MLLSHHQNAGQNWDIKIANRMSENVVTVQIFGNYSNKSKFDELFDVLFAKRNYNHQVKEDEMGGARSTNGGKEKDI
jgi:hypothetical protein